MTGRETGAYGCFALVTYVPAPLLATLQKLRAELSEDLHFDPHVTVLPPRPLSRPANEISSVMAEVVGDAKPFDLVLDQVCAFSDTSVLYLSVGKGYDKVENLHTALAAQQGDNFCEEHDFRPHLTLAGPLPEQQLDAARLAAETSWRKIRPEAGFWVDQIEFLWLAPGGGKADWQRLWSKRMGVSSSETVQAYPLRNEANHF